MLDEGGGRPGGPTVALDCRWLGIGGAGRVTELLLAGLRAAPPDGTWLLWGDPARIGEPGIPGARVVAWRGDPTRLMGQADLGRVPRAGVVVYLHQIRPLRPGSSVTVIHDTIPLRHGGSRPVRALKRLYLRTAARLSDRIVTVSEASRDAIVRDLGVRRSRIVVTSLGVDDARVARIRSLRAAAAASSAAVPSAVAGDPGVPFVLYVGRFAEHKNLRRASRAFARTAFAGGGGRLVLVGGTTGEAAELSAWSREAGLACVDVRTACPEDELDRLLATCRALLAPSLEEGFGLPAVEAAAAGVPVASSPTGAAPAIPADRLVLLDPYDEGSIAAAIDAAVTLPVPVVSWAPRATVAADVVAAVRAVSG